MNYRPSKSFLRVLFVVVPLLAAAIFALWPELEALRNPPVPGDFVFPKELPSLGHARTPDKRPRAPQDTVEALPRSRAFPWADDFIEKNLDELLGWKHNPWKSARPEFGAHFLALLGSKDPRDQARLKELRRQADLLRQRLVERYPELAVTMRNVPPERNGYLQWLEFRQRFQDDPARPGPSGSKVVEIPPELDDKDAWDPAIASRWVARERLLLDQVRAIGLLPEESMGGIDLDWSVFPNARLAVTCTQALMIEARLAAEQGDLETAFRDVAAAQGLARHFGQTETPTLIDTTIAIVIRRRVQTGILDQIIPSLPPDKVDLAAWENAAQISVGQPQDFARVMRGGWHSEASQLLLPLMADTEDPNYPPDPEALMDAHTSYFAALVRSAEGASLANLPEAIPAMPSLDDLSYRSQELMKHIAVSGQPWSRGWQNSQASEAMTRAAFAVLRGAPVPNDPILGQPYVWDPATRTLSPPDDPFYQKLQTKPITLPQL